MNVTTSRGKRSKNVTTLLLLRYFFENKLLLFYLLVFRPLTLLNSPRSRRGSMRLLVHHLTRLLSRLLPLLHRRSLTLLLQLPLPLVLEELALRRLSALEPLRSTRRCLRGPVRLLRLSTRRACRTTTTRSRR